MKKTIVLYWIFTGLFAAAMIFPAIPEIQNGPDSVKFMAQLGYPAYMNVFVGVAKIIGVIAILIPGFPRLKEWAYAGLFFDLAGATYSQLATKPEISIAFMLIWYVLLFASYIWYHKKLALTTANNNP